MLPLLKTLADGGKHKFSPLVAKLGSDFGLTEKDIRAIAERNAVNGARDEQKLHRKRRERV
jgi:hypothetical protein